METIKTNQHSLTWIIIVLFSSLNSLTTESKFIDDTRGEMMSSDQVESSSPINSKTKICVEGYQVGEFGHCEDIDECVDRNDTCPDSSCFNIPGSFKCCPNGTRLNQDNECLFIDQCQQNPCPQSTNMTDNQFWCVNYYTDRDCVNKSVKGYQLLNAKDNIQQLVDWKNKSLARYLELTKTEITLKGDFELFDNHHLIKLQLQQGFNCNWKFKLDQVWSASKDDAINESQFVTISEPFKCFVYINGLVKPQSFAVSLTCNINYQPYYQNTIYITFKPKPK